MSTHINISLKQLTWHLTGDGWGPPPFLGNIWWDIGLEIMSQCPMYTGTVSRWAVSYQARCHYRYCLINLNENLSLIQHSLNTGDSIMGQTHDNLGIITCLVIRNRPICQSSIQILIWWRNVINWILHNQFNCCSIEHLLPWYCLSSILSIILNWLKQ